MTFRHWLQEMWFQHVDESAEYGILLPYTSKEYFNKYKYWLKREYRHQQGVE